MVSAEALMFLLWHSDGSAPATRLSLVSLQGKATALLVWDRVRAEAGQVPEVGAELSHAMHHIFVSIFLFFFFS